MHKNRLSFSEAKRISITEYLTSSGFEPASIRGEDYWYQSPFRKERTPSFKVNTKLNVWYDHGTGEGGTILDLGAKLNQCSLVEFLGRLSDGNNSFSFHRQAPKENVSQNSLEILAARDLQHYDLLRYLRERRISNAIATQFCKEIDFKIRGREYKAIGFPNRSGAWELRNSWFKGSSAPKDVSILNYGSNKLAVLEGFMDFLSLQQTENKEMQRVRNQSDFLILNSLQLLNRTIPLLQSHKEVTLLLDNDNAATAAKDDLKQKGIQFNDLSSIYIGHKDVNEFHVASRKAQQRDNVSPKKSRRMRR